MSKSLFWKPVGPGEIIGGITLRTAIENRYGHNCILDDGCVEFLRGLAAAGVEGAQKLVDIILEHGQIEIEIRS